VVLQDEVVITVTGGEKGLLLVYLPLVGLFADMIRPCTSTVNEDVDITVFGDLSEDGFSHRRATYVAQAYDENFRCHER